MKCGEQGGPSPPRHRRPLHHQDDPAIKLSPLHDVVSIIACPVVLDFDGVQVEVCHRKLDELSIGWGTIDAAAAIAECSGFTPAA